MTSPDLDTIEVLGLRVWAPVGVLERERLQGQWFNLAIQALQRQARQIRGLTIDHDSAQVLDLLEALYGPVAIELRLAKCRAPVAGFSGEVAVIRRRRW